MYMCVEHFSSNGTSGSDDDLDTLSDLLNTTALREAATKLEDAKLSLEGLKDVLPDTLLINSLLVAADIQAPGDRLAIINALMKSRNARSNAHSWLESRAVLGYSSASAGANSRAA